MAGVCFYYENPNIDICSGKDLFAWGYNCLAAGDIDKMIVINLSDTTPQNPGEVTGQECEFRVVQSLTQAKALMAGDRITQVVCPWDFENPTELWDYDHKTDWYVFGPAEGWQGHDLHTDKVTIPSSDIRPPMFSVHAATVVLSHRYKTLAASW